MAQARSGPPCRGPGARAAAWAEDAPAAPRREPGERGDGARRPSSPRCATSVRAVTHADGRDRAQEPLRGRELRVAGEVVGDRRLDPPDPAGEGGELGADVAADQRQRAGGQRPSPPASWSRRWCSARNSSRRCRGGSVPAGARREAGEHRGVDPVGLAGPASGRSARRISGTGMARLVEGEAQRPVAAAGSLVDDLVRLEAGEPRRERRGRVGDARRAAARVAVVLGKIDADVGPCSVVSCPCRALGPTTVQAWSDRRLGGAPFRRTGFGIPVRRRVPPPLIAHFATDRFVGRSARARGRGGKGTAAACNPRAPAWRVRRSAPAGQAGARGFVHGQIREVHAARCVRRRAVSRWDRPEIA